MFAQYTTKFRQIVTLARQEALRLRHESIEFEHILLAMAIEATAPNAHLKDFSFGTRALVDLGADFKTIRQGIEKHLLPGTSTVERPMMGHQRGGVMERIDKEAYHLSGCDDSKPVILGTEHLLLAMLTAHGQIARSILEGLNPPITFNDARRKIQKIMVGLGDEATHFGIYKPGDNSQDSKPSDDQPSPARKGDGGRVIVPPQRIVRRGGR